MNDMLQKLEDKVVSLVDELDALRGKLKTLVKENQELRYENQTHREKASADQEKLQGIVNLLDSMEENPASTHHAQEESSSIHLVENSEEALA